MLDSYCLSPRTYYLYGHSISSTLPLPYHSIQETNSADIEITTVEGPFLSKEVDEALTGFDESVWFHHVCLPDGSDVIRWTGLFDFLVSANGRKIVGRSLTCDSLERFQSYLLGQVLSFAMVRQGIEPLHSTVVVREKQAIAFLGDSGYGKSTLAGAFLQEGFQVLTDDILIVKKDTQKCFAYPGPPRIKLFPNIARTLLAGYSGGTAMNPGTTKLIIPLPQKDVAQRPVELNMVYVLCPPDVEYEEISIHKLSPSQAFLAFIQNTFNTIIKNQERLTNQFKQAAILSTGLPVKSLSYPRELSWLSRVVNAILMDFRQA